ncbi:hypothetical protein NQ318_007582 [Aromia moschata]|uniref:Uncharacterized protein n=1 Tax=Aromia moschata TaxID=1265417 RepID=A0AAV8YAH0_9CUCU|nr:hypothetical protein NQ318_007582 [Aromia moschata]
MVTWNFHGSGLCFTVTVFQFAVRFPRKYLGSLLSGQSVCGITVSLIQIFTLAMGSSSKITAFIYFAIGDTFIFAVLVLFSQVLVKDKYFQASLASDEGKDEKGKNKQDPLDKSQLKRILIALIPILLTILLTSGSAGIVHPGISSLIESVGKGSGRWNGEYRYKYRVCPESNVSEL